MPEESICTICGRANPIGQPRCINCGQRAQGVVLTTEEKPASTTPWWTSANGNGRPSLIPPPPQVREEVARAEAALEDRNKREIEREKRLLAAQEREQRIRAERAERARVALEGLTGATAAPTANTTVSTTASTMALAADCVRCGTPLETTAGGQGFSFCLRCGAQAAAPAAPAMTATHQTQQTLGTAGTGPTAVPFSPVPLTTTNQTTSNMGRTVALAGTVSVADRPVVGVSPGLATVLSFFLPGLGQLVNGQVAKAALLLLASFVFATIWHLPVLVILIGRVIAAVDAYRIASRRRAGSDISDGEWDLG